MDRPYARGRDRRELVMTAAAKVFARSGYGATPLSAIAKEAGMTDAGLLHHFGSKESLYLEVLNSRFWNGTQQVLTDPESTLTESIDSFIEFVEHAAQDPDLILFRAVLSGESLFSDNPAKPRLEQSHRHALDVLSAKIRRAQADGDVRPDVDAEAAALELYALNEGYRHLWAANPGTFDLGASFAAAARRWLDSLARP